MAYDVLTLAEALQQWCDARLVLQVMEWEPQCTASEVDSLERIHLKAAGEFTGSQKGFTQKLLGKGFEQRRLSDGKAGLVGIGLKVVLTPGFKTNGDAYDGR